ncbi:MAG: DNA polymerase III subunit delta [Clostridia bacterium]|nr:DNA polymerase III subunit delta [Clostridia bacterium]
MSADVLKQDLKSGVFRRLYLLYVDEDYLKSHYCAKIIEKAVAKGMQGFNLQRFDGENFDLRLFAESVSNVPLMSANKCVVLRDLDPESLPQAQWKDFSGLLGDIPEGCIVILHFDALTPDKRSSRFKSLTGLAQKHGAAVELARMTPSEIEKWAYKIIAQHGCEIGPACLGYLVETCGSDMNTLSCEIEKFCACAAGGEITKEMIDSLAVRPLSATIYDLARAITSGKTRKGLQIIDELFYRREEPVVILAALSGAFCDLYRAKAALASGAGQADLERDFNYRGKEFRVRNALRDCRGVSLDYLAGCVDLLFGADEKLKSSRTDRRLLLEQLVVSLGALAEAEKRRQA